MSDQDLASIISQAKSGQLDALTALVEAMARDLRVFIATFATSRGMIGEVHTATWIKIRQELNDCPPTSQAITWVRQRAISVLRQQLDAERASAVSLRDSLRHLIAQDGSESLDALITPTNDGAALLNQRYAELDETAQLLLSRRYADQAGLSDLAREVNLLESDVAKQMFSARAGLHWRSTGTDQRPPEDPNLAIAIDQFLSERLDANGRQNLSSTLMKDLARAAAFSRQVRVDLMLHAVFGPYPHEEARSLANALVKIQHKRRNESSLLRVAAPPRTPVGSGTELRMANDRIAARHSKAPSSAMIAPPTRAISRTSGGSRRNHSSADKPLIREHSRRKKKNPIMVIGCSIAAVGLIGLLVIWRVGGESSVASVGAGSSVATILATNGNARLGRGDTVQVGDRIKKGDGLENALGETRVEIAGSARVVLGPATLVTSFDTLSDGTGQVLLSKGALDVLVNNNPGVEIRTAHGRVTFGIGSGMITCESDRTLVHAIKGNLTVVGADGSGVTQVAPGRSIEVLAGAAPRLLQPASFVRGINLGGATVTIDRQRWLSHREALSAGLSLGAGTSIAPQTMFAGTGLDFDRKTMLDTGLIGSAGPVQFSQLLPDGSYSLTLWMANSANLDVERMTLSINDQPIALAGTLLKRDTWAQLGPLPIRASKGRIEVALAGHSNARIAGLALEAPNGDQLSLPSAVTITSPVNGASFYAAQGLTVRAEVVGKVKAVQFYSGDKKIGEATQDPFLAKVSELEPGDQRIVARALNFDGTTSVSLPLSVNVIPSFGTGTILLQRWNKLDGRSLTNVQGNPKLDQPPDSSITLNELASPINAGDKFYCRIRGYVHPPLTGSYVFSIVSDDEAELLLSTSDDPARAERIAHSPIAVGPRDWTKTPAQQSKPITLVAGQKYYIELRHKEHDGSDHGAAGWKLPDGTLERPIPGAHLSPFKP